MPELPDVEVLKGYLDSTALHQEIEAVDVNDEIVLEGITPDKLEHELVGCTFDATRRHGKHLFVNLQPGDWLELHFGMTGDLKYYKHEEQEPDYTQILFHFKNHYRLAYIMPRKLGEVQLIESPDDFIEENNLGPDALDLDFESFKDLLSGRRGMVKSTLMNQEILAGIGNVYSDEILYQAGIHPRTKVKELSDQQLHQLYDKMQDVLQTAIDHQAKPEQFPDSYLIPHRSEGEKCPKCAGEVKRIEVSGRGGYYCPSCQSK